jgi:hypothetical protein
MTIIVSFVVVLCATFSNTSLIFRCINAKSIMNYVAVIARSVASMQHHRRLYRALLRTVSI